jgi:hypothetical protein
MRENSIYFQKNYDGVEDWIACWAMELDLAERLIAMGWENSNGINLASRIKRLEEEINRLEILEQSKGSLRWIPI